MEQQIISKEIFGQRFSEILAASSETTYTIAERVSLTPATISRYANGLMAPKIPTLYMIAGIFGVNPLWLMGYDAPKFEFPENIQAKSSPSTDKSAPGENLQKLNVLASALEQLNEEGQDKLVDYADDLVASGKYIKSDTDKLGGEKYA